MTFGLAREEDYCPQPSMSKQEYNAAIIHRRSSRISKKRREQQDDNNNIISEPPPVAISHPQGLLTRKIPFSNKDAFVESERRETDLYTRNDHMPGTDKLMLRRNKPLPHREHLVVGKKIVGEEIIPADAATSLSTNTEDVNEEGLDVNLVDELPPYTPPIQDLKQFPQEYYDSQDVYIATFRRILNALIERSTVMKKLCDKLQRDNDGNIIIDVHPIFANGVNVQGNNACTIVVGHYASVRQGKKGIMTERGEGTCLTFNQLLAAARTVDPSFTLRNFGFSEDVLPLKFGFENTKGPATKPIQRGN